MKENEVYPQIELFDVQELNEIVNIYNNGDLSIYDFVGRVWNKAFYIGFQEGISISSKKEKH